MDKQLNDFLDEVGACMIGDQSVFSFLCDENIGEYSNFFQYKTVKSGEVIWREGDACDYVAIISSGRVEVKKETEFEGKHMLVGTYSRGAVIGALCILNGETRAVTATALEDVSLIVITRENFNSLLENNPELGVKLLKGMLASVSMRLRKSFERLARFF